MTELGIYLVGSFIVLIFLFGALIENGISKRKPGFIVLGIIGFISFLILYIPSSKEYNQPKAIDVYQGKTTLEYTMRDGVVIDSVVVYKEGINK